MNLKEFNNLVDFFFYQADRQNPNEVFLEWLNPINRKSYTWSETVSNIYKISKIIKQISNKAVQFQSGYIYDYAFVMLIGLSALITYLIFT